MDFKTKSSYGPNGLAEVRLLKEKVKVIFEEDGDIYELPLDAWDKERPQGHYIVGLNKDRTDISFLKPPGKRTWYCKFQEFRRDGSDTPTPYIAHGGVRHRKDGGTWIADDEMRFKYVFTILDPGGAYDGLTLVGNLPYIFEQKVGTTECEVLGKKGQLERMEKFLRVTGFDFTGDTLQYSPNVLPQLEKMLQDKGSIFSVTTNEKGFIDDMAEVPANFLPKNLS